MKHFETTESHQEVPKDTMPVPHTQRQWATTYRNTSEIKSEKQKPLKNLKAAIKEKSTTKPN